MTPASVSTCKSYGRASVVTFSSRRLNDLTLYIYRQCVLLSPTMDQTPVMSTAPNYECMAGLIPFIIVHLRNGSWIALSVVLNGLAFHYTLNGILKWFDILCNVAFTTYVNFVARDRIVSALTVIGCVAYVCNSRWSGEHENKIHVVGVQFVLFLALLRSGL